jgi:hypothetical protein
MGYEPRGRPPEKGRKRSEIVTIKATPLLKRRIEVDACRCELSCADFVRGVFFSVLFPLLDEKGVQNGDEYNIDPGAYPDPFPKDYAEILEFAEDMRSKVRAKGSADELSDFMFEIYDFLVEMLSEYEDLKQQKRAREEKYEDERLTEKVNVRITPDELSWLEKMHGRQDPECEEVGFSSWIRCAVGGCINAHEATDRIVYEIERVYNFHDETYYFVDDMMERKERILELCDRLEEMVESRQDCVERMIPGPCRMVRPR